MGSSYVLCCESPSGRLLLSSTAHCTLLEIRAILLSRTSATLLLRFYSTLRRSFSLHKPVHAFIRALSPQSFFPPHPYSLTIIAFCTRLALFLLTCSLSSTFIHLSHGRNSTTAKAKEGLSR